MTHQQILEKAISKAIENGYGINAWKNFEKAWLQTDDYGYEIRISKGKNEKSIGWFPSEYDIIFNHDFAKALWGEEEIVTYAGLGENFRGIETFDTTIDFETPKDWRTHIQAMVIAEDPIEYLGNNI